MTPFDRLLRLTIYESFRDTGRRPLVKDLSLKLRTDAAEVTAGLGRLAAAHLVALEPETDLIWMAHPFSGVPTGFNVSVRGTDYVGNCAWDVIAIAALLGGPTSIGFQCHATGSRETVTVSDTGILGPGVIHHVVPAARFWDDVGFT